MSGAHLIQSSAKNPLIGAIWAQCHDGTIGDSGGMPWHVPEDLAHFKRVTVNHPVIMGRHTWDSFPEKFRPLPDRSNIVMTTRKELHRGLTEAGAIAVSSLQEALAAASKCAGAQEIWIIGGGQVFAEAMPLIDTALITQLDLKLIGDTKAPPLGPEFERVMSDPAQGWKLSTRDVNYRFESWQKTKGK